MTIHENTLTTIYEKPHSLWITVQRIVAFLFAVGITIAIISARETISDYAIYGYPGVFIISVIGNATLIFPAPSFTIVYATGAILNPYLVGIFAGCGAALGEMTGYLAGFSGHGIVENKDTYHKIEILMRKWGLVIIFLLALIPNPFFDFGGIMAGTLRIRWWKFLLVAACGKSIRFIILALIGEFSLGEW
ncbi:MAG: hypothetical protein B6242_03505 [Anaerolineaceae bacterium 4572_78]|nr:MAG: hypothetical protein B6242_03505 [Anaerolineaceae bacterium 4572_78]